MQNKQKVSTNTPSIVDIDKITESRKQSLSLVKDAELLIKNQSIDAAIETLCKALTIEPCRVTAIHKIGQCLEIEGAHDDAALCFRGVIPDCVNSRYFNSEEYGRKILTARQCDNVQVLPAYEYDSIPITAPKRNPEDKKRYGQFNYSITEARASFCTVAEGGSIWFDGFNTIALDQKGQLLKEHTKGNEFACLSTMENTKAVPLEGTVCFLDSRSSNIYYHWMLDVLPKLGVLEKSGIEISSIDYFIVKAKSSYQLETLKACGIPEEKIISTAVPQFFSADKMIIPYLRNDLGERVYQGLGIGLAQWIPLYLQQQFVPDAPVSKPASPKRIYISRSTRGSRNLANEAEIVKALKVRGFETVEFENYSVAGQAELMSNAEFVLGVHGAGFTNLSFCKPGTKVVEIFGDYIVPCYWALSAVTKLDYSQYMATSVSDDEQSADNPGAKINELRSMRILVDQDKFISYLDTLL